MKKRALIGLCGTMVLAQGCTLNLPAGLTNPAAWLPKPVVPTASPGSSGDDCAAAFKKLDKDGDNFLTLDEFLKAKGGKGAGDANARAFLDLDADNDRKLSAQEYAASCGGDMPRPATPKPATPPPSAKPGCEGSFTQFDADGDGQWTLEEFMAWEATRPRPAIACAEGLIFTNGGGLIANNGGGLISSNMAIMTRRQLLQVNSTGAGLIADNGRYVPNPCPPDDPAYRFGQFDHDGDGQVSAQEFCDGPGARPEPLPTSLEPYPFPYPSASPEPYPQSCDDGFFESDADGDGLVSRDEYRTKREEGPHLVFRNGDRWQPAVPDEASDFDQKDLDKDGYLSLEESCYGGPEPEPSDEPGTWCNFYKLDEDGDEQVTWEEFLAWSRQNTFPAPSKEVIYADFADRDFDQNFILTRDEWCGEMRPPTPPPPPFPFPWPSQRPPDNGLADCMRAFEAASKASGGSVSFEAYAQARIEQTRWVQKPSEDELEAQRQMWVDQARPFDKDGDGRLSVGEIPAFCGGGIPLGPTTNNVAGYRK